MGGQPFGDKGGARALPDSALRKTKSAAGRQRKMRGIATPQASKPHLRVRCASKAGVAPGGKGKAKIAQMYRHDNFSPRALSTFLEEERGINFGHQR